MKASGIYISLTAIGASASDHNKTQLKPEEELADEKNKEKEKKVPIKNR